MYVKGTFCYMSTATSLLAIIRVALAYLVRKVRNYLSILYTWDTRKSARGFTPRLIQECYDL